MLQALRFASCFLLALACHLSAQTRVGDAATTKYHIYTGVYTRGPAEGIYHHSFDAKTGIIGPASLATTLAVSPSFLAIHPNGKLLYALGETSKGKSGIFTIEKNGDLTPLQTEGIAKGGCHLNIDSHGDYLAMTQGSGFIVYRLKEDGSIADTLARVTHSWDVTWRRRPFVHSIYFDRDNKRILALDMACEKVPVYELSDDELKLVKDPFQSPIVKSGPRHLAFSPAGDHLYVLNELTGFIDVLSYDKATGKTLHLQSVKAFAKQQKKQSAAEIQTHPSLPYVYASIRGHGSISQLKISDGGASLEFVSELTKVGAARHFEIDPSGGWLIAGAKGKLTSFAINQKTGALSREGSVKSPGVVCVAFAPDTAQ